MHGPQLQRRLGTPTTLKAIPEGRAGVRVTLREMARLVQESQADYELIKKARSLVFNLPEKAWTAQARAIFYFVRDRIRYVMDPLYVETIAGPMETLETRQGDCDDKSVLAASLLQAIGHPARFVAVAYDRGPLSHVFVETMIGNEWWPMELTPPDPPQPRFEFGEYPDIDRITSWMTETIGGR
jgi:transglutaminase-like putative cysteine protease